MAMQSKLMLLKEITFLIFLFIVLLKINLKITVISIIFLSVFGSLFFLFFKKRVTQLGKTVEKNQQEQFEILNQTFLGLEKLLYFESKNL